MIKMQCGYILALFYKHPSPFLKGVIVPNEVIVMGNA